MDMHSNIRDLHDHREETEAFAREHLARGEISAKAKATAPTAAASAEFGSGWYHDAAIHAAGREAIEAKCHPVHW